MVGIGAIDASRLVYDESQSFSGGRSAAVKRLFGAGGSGGAAAPSAPVPLDQASYQLTLSQTEEPGIPRAVLIGATVVGVLAVGAVAYKLTRKKKR